MEYTAKLSDGSTVKLDADHEPTQDEILAAVEAQPKPEPMSAAKAFGVAAAGSAIPTLTAAAGAKLGFMAGEAAFPEFTPISGLAGLGLGALIGSLVGSKGQKKALEKFSPETAKKIEQLQQQAEKEHPLATAVGGFAPAAATFEISPGQSVRGAIGLAKVIKGTATLAEQQAAKTTATQLGMGTGFGVAEPLLEGEKPTLKGVGASALTALLLGEPRMKALRAGPSGPPAGGEPEEPAAPTAPVAPEAKGPTPEPLAPEATPFTPQVEQSLAQSRTDIALRAKQASARIQEIINRKAAGAERQGDAERKAAADLAIGAKKIEPVAPLTAKAIDDQAGLNFEKPPKTVQEPAKAPKTPPAEEKPAAPAKAEEPAPTEFLTAASFKHPETGEISTGANHIEAADLQGVEAPPERTARETPEFGFEVQDEKTGNVRYVSREEGEKIARANGQLVREPVSGKLHSDEVRFAKSKGELDAILKEAGTPVRDVQQPGGPEEGAGKVPADEAGKEAGKGGGELPQKAHELSAADVAKIDPVNFKAYRDELGTDTEARQFELAKETPLKELQKHAKAATAEVERAQKKAQAADVQEDPEGAKNAMEAFVAATTKQQFFNEVLQRVPKEVKAAATQASTTAQIERAMQLNKTRKLTALQRTALAQGIEAARKGDNAALEAAIEDAKKAEEVAGEKAPRGFPGRTRFDRETEIVGKDILAWIVENMKLLSKSGAQKLWGKEKFTKNKSLWDDAPSVFGAQDKKAPHHNIIYSPKGSTPDTVAKEAYRAGILKTGDTERDLWQAIKEASAKRAHAEETAAKETTLADVKGQQDSAWSEASTKGNIELTTEDVAIGDTIEVGGETLKVAGRDETGEVRLRGGEKFGNQVLGEGEKIYVDKHTPTTEGTGEFVSPQEEAKAEPAKAAAEAEAGQPPKEPALEAFEKSKNFIKEFAQAHDAWRQSVKEWADALPENKPAIFHTENHTYAVTKDPKGGWRYTYFSNRDKMPTGHQEFKTKGEAIVDLLKYNSDAKFIGDKMPFQAKALPARMFPGDEVIWHSPEGDKPVKFFGFLGGEEAGNAAIEVNGERQTVDAMDLVRKPTEAKAPAEPVSAKSLTLEEAYKAEANGEVAWKDLTREQQDYINKKNQDTLGAALAGESEEPATKKPAGGELFSKEEIPFNLMGERETAPKAAKPAEGAPDLFAPQAKPVEPEPAKPKVQERDLTKSEQKEYAELSRIARAAREEGGPQLTTDQTKRYEELSAMAGQQEFAGLSGEQADQLANQKVAEEKFQAQEKAQREMNRQEEAAADNPAPTDTPVAPVDTRTPMEILNGAKKLKVTGPEGATMVKVTDTKGRTSIQSIKEINKGANPFKDADIKKIEAGTIGKDRKFSAIKGEVGIKDAGPKKFSEGPGAASPSDFPDDSPLKQLTQLLKDWGEISPKGSAKERLTEGIDIAKAWAQGKDKTTGALGGMKAAGEALIDLYKNPPKWTDFKAAIGRWVAADSTTALEVREFQRQIAKSIPQKIRQEAITNWIQAHGDEAVLRARADASRPQFKKGYEAALTLTPDEKALAQNIGSYFESRLQEGMDAGLLRSAVEDYVTQIWKRNPQAGAKLIHSLFGGGELNPSFKFALKRIFENYFEGEQLGYVPKNKGIGYLLSVYDMAFNRALSARGFIKELNEGKAADGMPIAMISKPSVRQVPGKPEIPEAFLLKANQTPKEAVTEDGRAYRVIDHWALRGWKWAMTGVGGEKVPVTGQQELPGPQLAPTARTEAPVFVEGDMLVHPDHYEHLHNVLTRSKLADNPIASAILRFSSLAKQTKLSISPFHLTQEGVHALAHKVNPWRPPDINPHDPTTKALMEHGLMVQDPRGAELFNEGLSGGGLVGKVPVLGKAQTWFNDFLFRDYIPKLKVKMATEALERNRAQYAKEVQAGKITDDQLIALTADESNSAFGELNYRMIGRNQTLQDWLRLSLLAPDFLEARSRFVLQALRPYGREQLAAIARMGAVLFVGTRIMNKLLDDDMHMEKPFSLVAGGKEYRLRTILGDVQHLITDPRNFWYNRMSPITRTGVEYITSRDDRGIKRGTWEQMADFAKWFQPISVQSRTDIGRLAQLGTSAGIAVTQYNAQRRLYDVADKWMESNKDPAIRERYDRFKAETHVDSPYTPLKHALQKDDLEQARKEYDKLRETRKSEQIRKTMETIRPFTGSAASELKFKKSLTPDQMKLYNEAVKERKDLYQKFLKMRQGAK